MSGSKQVDRLMDDFGELDIFERDLVLPNLLGRLEFAAESGAKGHRSHAKYAIEQIARSISAVKTYRRTQQQATKTNNGE